MSHLASDGSWLQGRRILVVEDELLVAMEMEDLLMEQGCIIVGPAADVDEALALVGSERPDAVLLDLNLRGAAAVPVMSALCARGVPFIVVTGYSKRQSQSSELQHVPVLEKPVDHDALLRALQEAIGEPSGTASRTR